MLSLNYKLTIAIVLSLLGGVLLFITINKAFAVSQHPVISLVMRAIFIGLLSLCFFIRKKEIVIFLLLISFPIIRIGFNGIGLITIFSIILIVLYFKEVWSLVRSKLNVFSVSFCIILFSLFFSTIISKYPRDAMTELTLYLSLGGVYFVLTSYMESEEKIKVIIRLLLFIMVLCLCVSFYQRIFGISSIKFFFGDYNPNIGIHIHDKRIPSIFKDAQEAGQYFAVMTLFCIGLKMTYLRATRWVNVLIFGGMIALVLTKTRLAVFTFIIFFIILILFILSYRKKFIPIVLFFVLFSFFLILLKTDTASLVFKGRFNKYDVQKSFNYRYKLWYGSLPIIIKNPLGVGLGGRNLYAAGFKENVFFMNHFVSDINSREHVHFENSYLQILYSLGIPGFIGFLMLIVKYFTSGFVMLKKCKKNYCASFSLYLLICMSIWLICIIANPLVRQTQAMFIFIILLALMNSLKQVYPQI